MNGDVLAFEICLREGNEIERAILQQHITALVRFFDGVAPYRSRLDLEILLRFANDQYKEHGVFCIRERRASGGRKPSRRVVFEYTEGFF